MKVDKDLMRMMRAGKIREVRKQNEAGFIVGGSLFFAGIVLCVALLTIR